MARLAVNALNKANPTQNSFAVVVEVEQRDVVSWDEVLDVQVILSCSCWSLLHCAMMYPPDAS